ncbi:alpha/beta fold hydrolase [Terriglobus sp. TAA 43]|uniref:alpha/beta fold hydrolase n=1 Tax=Terriglobus sp. TAA 43 TaxID=278961 RepID=UPI0006457F2F|nr:alpha/beta fold hydrolase [Terriglobus sp. TAA 43]
MKLTGRFCGPSLLICMALVCRAQKAELPRVDDTSCLYTPGDGYDTRCGYLVVAENRGHPEGRVIKLPFIYVKSKNKARAPDPVLYTGGGPGVSSLHPVTSISRRSLLVDRDYIAFEQRGTHFALPNLECDGEGTEVQRAYLEHRSPDAARLAAVRACRKKLVERGIDLSAYSTDESAADIEDLRKVLKIDLINLMGISYSGGIMMAVLRKYPEHIRSLILDSPLPEFVNIDEQELANFDEALTMVLDGVDRKLTPQFRAYFSSIEGKSFSIHYRLKDGRNVDLSYGRSELLSILHSKLEDYDGIKQIPQIVLDMVSERAELYVKEYFDGVFANNGGVSGMRISVYCSDKMAYEDPDLIAQQEKMMPWLAGFHVNDVFGAVCQEWHVKPIHSATKKPYYSTVPVLLGAGGLDDACRPLYNDMIHHYFPNSQRLLFTKRMHGPLLNSLEGDLYIHEFLNAPDDHLASKPDIDVY